ncbi:hypothetical protein [Zavarzinella formosa]|uniref:hypothetical protein n=1 Tax=Zavarzinella formosa TaxID=360055 RepID=UPI0002D5FC21|nr:hypothetical protein [Zavarzinella formosa]
MSEHAKPAPKPAQAPSPPPPPKDTPKLFDPKKIAALRKINSTGKLPDILT